MKTDLQTDLENMQMSSAIEGNDHYDRLIVTYSVVENIILNFAPEVIVKMFEPIGIIDETNVQRCIADCHYTVEMHDLVDGDEYRADAIIIRSHSMLVNIASYLTGLNPAVDAGFYDDGTSITVGVTH